MNTSRLSMFSLCLVVAMLVTVGSAKAQFSKPVVVFTGKVRNAQTLEPHSVKVSVREVGNKTREITASKSNASTGHYLLVLKPQTKYWLHVEGNGVAAKDILIETPAAHGKTVTINEDIPVNVQSLKNHSARQ